MIFRPGVPGFGRIGLPVLEGGLELIWFPPSVLSVQDVGMGRDIFRTNPLELMASSVMLGCPSCVGQPVKILFLLRLVGSNLASLRLIFLLTQMARCCMVRWQVNMHQPAVLTIGLGESSRPFQFVGLMVWRPSFGW